MGTVDQALAGIRVLDLSGASGQYAGKLFAELGAQVLLVEPPGGSPVRRDEPFLEGCEGPDASLAFSYFNTGKRGLVLDWLQPEGRTLLHALAQNTDLLIESARPGQVDAPALLQAAPHLVLTSISPFGQTGPYALHPAEDLTVLALGGLLSLGGYPDSPPLAPYGNQAQLAAAMFAAVASMMALYAAEAGQPGQHIDVSMQACVAMGLENAVQFVDLENVVRQRDGGQQRQAGTGVFNCADGQVYLMAGGIANNKFWTTTANWLVQDGAPGAAVLQQPQWLDRAYLLTEEAKRRFADVFVPFAATLTQAELYRRTQARRIPLCPIATPADLPGNVQLLHRGLFSEMLHPASRRQLLAPGAPYRLSATPWQRGRPAPRLGEHTSQVLRELGIGAAEEQRLRDEGVVA